MSTRRNVSIAIGIIFFLVANYYLYNQMMNIDQGDHEFVEVDFDTNKSSKKPLRLNNLYITGFTFFELNGTSYFSYISGDIDIDKPRVYSLSVINLEENTTNTIILNTCQNYCEFTGLSLASNNGTIELITLYRNNSEEFEILHLSTVGDILKRIPVDLGDLYFNPNGLYYFDSKYVTAVGKFTSSKSSEPASTILIIDSQGTITNEIFFGIDQISNVAVSNETNTLFVTKSESKTINQYNMTGFLIGNIKLSIYPNMMFITDTNSIIVNVYNSETFTGIAGYLVYPTSDFESVYLVHYYAAILSLISYYTFKKLGVLKESNYHDNLSFPIIDKIHLD
ncbi:MAG: hypothetical protein GPJ54_19715 [Candidatus Heimdallarchaeota archaeon]|nr:hypothetical protein [Candidatus Heimdallarchaeota archaeon]